MCHNLNGFKERKYGQLSVILATAFVFAPMTAQVVELTKYVPLGHAHGLWDVWNEQGGSGVGVARTERTRAEAQKIWLNMVDEIDEDCWLWRW